MKNILKGPTAFTEVVTELERTTNRFNVALNDFGLSLMSASYGVELSALNKISQNALGIQSTLAISSEMQVELKAFGYILKLFSG